MAAIDPISSLCERLGPEALAWLLNSDAVTVRSWSQRIIDPPGDTRALASQLHSLVESVSKEGSQPGDFAVATMLGRYVPDRDMTVAAVVRAEAGGSLDPDVDTDDPIASPLIRLAAQLAGVHLLKPGRELRVFVGAHAMGVGLGHPLADEVLIAAKQSLPLDRWSEEGHIMMRSSGSGGPFNPVLLASQLLVAAAFRWMLAPEWPDVQRYFEAVLVTVEDFRRIINGRTAHVPALFGMAGIQLSQGSNVTLPWGRLRPLRAHETERLPESSAETVLEAGVPVRAFLCATDDMSLSEEIGQAFALRVKLMRDTVFSLMLAGLWPPAAALSPVFTFISDPSQGPPQGTYVAPTPVSSLEVSPTTASEVERWARDYERHHHRSLDVAVRRCVAAARRDDMSDAFVDAVIGWDNLFGSAAGEAQLRIAISFAQLLGTDAASRRELATQVKQDYELRSRLVHGDLAELPPTEATAARDRAVELLLRSLRTLYRDRRDLLRLNSGQRSHTLLLGEIQAEPT